MNELLENKGNGDDEITRGIEALAALRLRNTQLEAGLATANLAIESRNLELQHLKLALSQAENRATSIQASADERVAEYQHERDLFANEAAELRAVYCNIKHLLERTTLPLSRITPPQSTGMILEQVSDRMFEKAISHALDALIALDAQNKGSVDEDTGWHDDELFEAHDVLHTYWATRWPDKPPSQKPVKDISDEVAF